MTAINTTLYVNYVDNNDNNGKLKKYNDDIKNNKKTITMIIYQVRWAFCLRGTGSGRKA